MSRSIFAKNLPNGGLGTKPQAPKAQVLVAVTEYITPTLQRLTYTKVDADSALANPDAGQEVTAVDFYKAPNPIVADVEPATTEFGKGASIALPGCVESANGGAMIPLAPLVVPITVGDKTTDHWKETVGGGKSNG